MIAIEAQGRLLGVTQVLTGKLVLLIFLMVDTAYVARIMRREARTLRRRVPRWHGPELILPGCSAITAGAEAHVMRKRFHDRLDRWLDEQARRAPDEELPDLRHPRKRDAI
jgi:hypothetical protein